MGQGAAETNMPGSWERIVALLGSCRLPLPPGPHPARRGLPVAGWLPLGGGPLAGEARLGQPAPGRQGSPMPVRGLSLSVRLLPAAGVTRPAMAGRAPAMMLAQTLQPLSEAGLPKAQGAAVPPALPIAFPGARSLGRRGCRRAPAVHSAWRLAGGVQAPAEGSGLLACEYRTRSML